MEDAHPVHFVHFVHIAHSVRIARFVHFHRSGTFQLVRCRHICRSVHNNRLENLIAPETELQTCHLEQTTPPGCKLGLDCNAHDDGSRRVGVVEAVGVVVVASMVVEVVASEVQVLEEEVVEAEARKEEVHSLVLTFLTVQVAGVEL